jgi:hypothetical protein
VNRPTVIPEKTTIYDQKTGDAKTVFNIDAREAIASGRYALTPPPEPKTKKAAKEAVTPPEPTKE